MADVEVFKGRGVSLATDRVAVVASGQYALFFEFFENDYHVYGTRRASPHDVLATAFNVSEAINPSTAESATYRVLTSTETILMEKPVKLYELKRVIAAHASNITYMDITTRSAHLWADIDASRIAHFGVATSLRIYDRPLTFLRQLTPVTLDDTDLADIADMLRTYTSERYRVQ